MQPQNPLIPNADLPPVPTQPTAGAAAPFALPNSIAKNNVAPPPSTVHGDAPEIADDGDLIEKEWIAKIKQIVIKTTQSPFEQSQQFTQLKLDYLHKRYGKTIKSET